MTRVARVRLRTVGVDRSVLAREEPMSERAQCFCSFAEWCQRMDGLIVQQADSLLRCGYANDSRVRGLGALAIGARGLPEGGGVARDSQQVVLDLECETDRIRKSRQSIVKVRIERRRALSRHQHAGPNHRAGLARVHVFHLAEVEPL